MCLRAITFAAALIFICLTVHLSVLVAAPLQSQPSDVSRTAATHLVLTNGQVVVGRISRNSDSVFVQTDGGSRVVFPVERVDFVCKSLKDAYWQKNARIKATDLNGHVQLFHWCMKQGLLNEAQNQIDLLVSMEIKAVQLEYLNRQLSVALTQQAKARLRLMAGTPVQTDSQATSADEKIELVGFATESSTAAEIERLNQLKRIEAAIDSLPKASVGVFKRKIEPLLIRNCSACHTDESIEVMPLARLGLNQVIPKRLSQRNLYHVLKQTDLNEPLSSPLFAAAVAPHAGREEPILEKGSVQYTNLGRWLIEISARPHQRHQVPDFEAMASLPGARTTASERLGKVPVAESPDSSQSERVPDAPDIPRLDQSTISEATALDPFDPDLFNKKYLNRKKEQD
ncbi:MAG: hypothetical protein VYE64_00160 [Planctomycetota bacterium]|nr:hypothetical protein [Planctomycetota bacterium]